MGGYESFDRAAPVPAHFGPKPFRPGTPQPKSYFYGAHRAGLHSLAKILNLALVSKSKVLSASTTIKRECYTLKDSEGVSKLKGMPGSTTIKLQGSITNKSTAREYNNKKESTR